MNHRWKDNVCVHCGIVRERKYWKLLMAITDTQPYDHYQRGVDWRYGIPNEDGVTVKSIGFERPDCQKTKNKVV